MIADAKRGDVPSTARAYAAAFAPLADAVTVNPYLGYDSLEPFFAHDGLGVLVDPQDVQSGQRRHPGPAARRRTAALAARRGPRRRWGDDLVGARGLSSLGAVVGATHPEVLETVRSLMPRAVLLLPGVGAQGGRPEDLAPAFSRRPGERARLRLALGHLRGRGAGWQEAAAAEAARLAGELRAVAVPG